MAFAVIDIGSNSIRYMGRGEKALATTRLAEGLDKMGRLSQSAMERSLKAVRLFAARAEKEGLTPVVYATSAVRDAQNRDVFLRLLFERCGLTADVLSGEDEARYALLGASGGSGGLIDIGGGSSQIITAGSALSFPLGCVRLKDALLASRASYGEALQAFTALCRGVFTFPRLAPMPFKAVGGTAHTLAALKLALTRYDSARVDGAELALGDIDALAHGLFLMGDARKNHPLLKDRHDIIVYGAMLLAYIMRGLALSAVTVSSADGMEGYALYKTHSQTKNEER